MVVAIPEADHTNSVQRVLRAFYILARSNRSGGSDEHGAVAGDRSPVLEQPLVREFLMRVRAPSYSQVAPDSHLNVLFTTYFFKQIDPQRKVHAPGDDIKYIEPWYFSMVRLGLYGVVFHDGLSEEFVRRYQTDRISFEYVPPAAFQGSLNDYRFFIYRQYLMERPQLRNVFMTDGNDLFIVQNPFRELRTDRIYVGSEVGDVRKSRWMMRRFQLLNRGGRRFDFKLSRWRTNPIYSAGILGGSYEMCMEFLNDMTGKFESLDPEQRKLNLNMAVFNHTVYERFRHRRVTGVPIHSLYKRYESDRQDVWFIHK